MSGKKQHGPEDKVGQDAGGSEGSKGQNVDARRSTGTEREAGDIGDYRGRSRAELKNTGVTVTCLMPGATETEFFERADMLDTKIDQGKKDDPADVARVGFDAMMRGDGDVLSGSHNKLQPAIANVTPAAILAERHRRMAEPGSAEKANE